MQSEKDKHLATMIVVEREDGIYAFVTVADEPGDWVKIPPHVAAQLPMAINMIKSNVSTGVE